MRDVIQRKSKDQTGNNRDLIRLKNVCCHTGAIADIITHKVSYDSRIARVIFRNARFYLSY